MYYPLILSFIIILLLKFYNLETPVPIFGIYRRPGKWHFLKIMVFYCLLQLRKIVFNLRKQLHSTHSGYGVKSRNSVEKMECWQPLSAHPKAIDAVYFNLSNEDGCYLITGAAHRPNNVTNGFIYIRLPGLGLLLSPKLPDTTLFRSETDKEGNYGAEGLCITPFQPMRTWRLQYKGKMKLSTDTNKIFSVEMNAVWNSGNPYFDFDTDMNPLCISRAMALEPWSQEYFQWVKSSHQTHYEQFGNLHGAIKVNGKQYIMKLSGVRDHSYGEKREWKNFHRYVLHYITLDSGMKISAGIVCSPLTFSRLEIGYIYNESGEVFALEECNLKLHQHGQNGAPPNDYGFSVKADGKWFHIQVNVKERSEFYIGFEWEARVVECMAHFSVNGVKGWGAAEWQYRHMGGRPHCFAENDPVVSK